MGGEHHLLLVDDEPDMLETLQDILEEFGWRVFCAPSGEKALEQLRDLSASVVLMDYKMPGLSGVETARIMLQQRPELLILLMSADVGESWKNSALEQGVRHVVQKPLDVSSVLRLLSEYQTVAATP